MIEFERSLRFPRPLNIISMVDIMLVLIIFFMVTGSLEKLDIVPISPPVADAGDELDQGPVLVVLGRHEEILINDELIMPQELLDTIKKLLKESPARLITVKADAQLNARRLIEVLDAINEAGGTKLTIATQKP